MLTLMVPSISRTTGKKLWVSLSTAVLVSFSDSCSFSGTGTGDSTLLQTSVLQSVNHCDVPSGAALGLPWQQCYSFN